MKYILMMNTCGRGRSSQPGAVAKRICRRTLDFMQGFNRDLRSRASSSRLRALRSRTGEAGASGKGGAPVTDGVFPESKEFLAGFWIVDVETPERAYAIAARVSAAPEGRRRASQYADRGASGHERTADRRCCGGGRMNGKWPVGTKRRRACCANWRRRCSASWPGGFATFPRPKTRCRKHAGGFRQWPREGVPENPRGWLIRVALRRMTDMVRSEIARRERETAMRRRRSRRWAGRRRNGDRGGHGSGRHAHSAVHVLPSGAQRVVGNCADAASGGRADDGGDCQCISGSRGDDGAADQPRKAEHQGIGGAVSRADIRRSAGSGCPRFSMCCT